MRLRHFALAVIALASFGTAAAADSGVETSALWADQIVHPSQAKFYALPKLPPNVEWFRLSVVTNDGANVHVCLRYGAPPVLPLYTNKKASHGHCSEGMNLTITEPQRTESGRYYALVFTDLGRFGSQGYVVDGGGGGSTFALVIAFPKPSENDYSVGKDTTPLGREVAIQPTGDKGQIYHTCFAVGAHTSAVVFHTHGQGDESQQYKVVVAPPGETIASSNYRIPSHTSKADPSQQEAVFTYIHPGRGRWCLAIQTSMALGIPLTTVARTLECPEGFTGKKCEAPVSDLFASRVGAADLNYQFLTVDGEVFEGITSKSEPIKYVRFHIDEEMVGGLLELELHCHHVDCHQLKMTPSHPLTSSELYSKQKSDDIEAKPGEHSVLFAASRFPRAGWWYVAIEADEGSALHYTLSVRIHCSGYCGGHGVCRLHKEQGLSVGLCDCKMNWAGDTCATELVSEWLMAVQVTILCLSTLAMLPAVRLALQRGLWAECAVFAATMFSQIIRHIMMGMQPRTVILELEGLSTMSIYLTLFTALWYTTGNEPVSGDAIYIIAFMVVFLLQTSGWHLGLFLIVVVVCLCHAFFTLYSKGDALTNVMSLFENPSALTSAVVLWLTGSLFWYLAKYNATYYWLFAFAQAGMFGSCYFFLKSQGEPSAAADGYSMVGSMGDTESPTSPLGTSISPTEGSKPSKKSSTKEEDKDPEKKEKATKKKGKKDKKAAEDAKPPSPTSVEMHFT